MTRPVDSRPRAERDLPAVLRASEEACALWWQEQANQPKRCLSCGAEWPVNRKDGDPPPCGH